jgi:hypothetical protein
MIPIPSGSRVWIATGHKDKRRGMQGLALQVQGSQARPPYLTGHFPVRTLPPTAKPPGDLIIPSGGFV